MKKKKEKKRIYININKLLETFMVTEDILGDIPIFLKGGGGLQTVNGE